MNSATNVDIIRTFKDLIERNGTTTTLDVKNELRSNGYWVTQATVSKVLQDFEEEADEYSFTRTGLYRTYCKVVPVTVDIDDNLDDDNDIDDDVDVVTWITWAKQDPGSKTLYEGTLTKNQAKSIFAKEHNIAYIDVRVAKE